MIQYRPQRSNNSRNSLFVIVSLSILLLTSALITVIDEDFIDVIVKIDRQFNSQVSNFQSFFDWLQPKCSIQVFHSQILPHRTPTSQSELIEDINSLQSNISCLAELRRFDGDENVWLNEQIESFVINQKFLLFKIPNIYQSDPHQIVLSCRDSRISVEPLSGIFFIPRQQQIIEFQIFPSMSTKIEKIIDSNINNNEIIVCHGNLHCQFISRNGTIKFFPPHSDSPDIKKSHQSLSVVDRALKRLSFVNHWCFGTIFTDIENNLNDHDQWNNNRCIRGWIRRSLLFVMLVAVIHAIIFISITHRIQHKDYSR